MKIAVTYENGQIFQHFGHTEQFKVYEIKDGKIGQTKIVGTEGSGHGALAGFLKAEGVARLSAEESEAERRTPCRGRNQALRRRFGRRGQGGGRTDGRNLGLQP